ncbi:arsenate reductase/amino-acid N-acetyltransferase [Phyllobacterium sp. YR620]|nr:arsenate reductase/amino-acid N-acetyltransferase [Phyllobacterium sp. YR620]
MHEIALEMLEGLQAEPIASSDVDFRSALRSLHLPAEDLDQSSGHFFRFWDTDRTTVGYGGTELTEDGVALLRSIVVLPEHQHHGNGGKITKSLLRYASGQGAMAAYLLTTDCEPFFGRLGFQRIERADAPSSISQSTQAADLCPSSASLMTRPTGV